ncbi:hypothetical protein [Actinomadura sp. WMMB 499]|uniref:hypothetical protein n=1 Tax=Actinomadura sp. WMMB 499 TaxID=1219491 RepID=UPI0012441F98|nr:hypothetical protein [Actinomadura sp. WMMB 499]QFG22055.1 hypothetical protein F7P10_13925 [Actinomadura sp. WMMB 499]
MSDETILLFRNTMRITDGHLDEFRDAIARAVEFAERHGPQLMVQTFVDEERMLAHSFQLYRDSDAVRRHWELADPYIQDVMEHCRVEHFEVFGEPDAGVAAGLRSSLGDRMPAFPPRAAGFLRFGTGDPSGTVP